MTIYQQTLKVKNQVDSRIGSAPFYQMALALVFNNKHETTKPPLK